MKRGLCRVIVVGAIYAGIYTGAEVGSTALAQTRTLTKRAVAYYKVDGSFSSPIIDVSSKKIRVFLTESGRSRIRAVGVNGNTGRYAFTRNGVYDIAPGKYTVNAAGVLFASGGIQAVVEYD